MNPPVTFCGNVFSSPVGITSEILLLSDDPTKDVATQVELPMFRDQAGMFVGSSSYRWLL